MFEFITRNQLADNEQGTWLVTDAYPYMVYCSECYIILAAKDICHTHIHANLNYCPNCGRKMNNPTLGGC